MDPPQAGHPYRVQRASTALLPEVEVPAATPAPVSTRVPAPPVPCFAELYDAHFAFVWRSARRLGVPEDHLDDVVQDVFLVVYRRLDSFEGRSKHTTWIFGILRRVVRDHRRRQQRKPTEPLREEPPAPHGDGPLRAIEQARARALVLAALDDLDPPFREVLVLADLEQMTAPDIAEALELNLNTVYSRLRTARQRFEKGLRRRTTPADAPGRKP